MKISIAMATYNGSKYLHEQLESFISQTRLPDELIVCDDGSDDGTIEILEEYRLKVPFAMHIYRNETNLGYIKNFEKAMMLSTGDVIFLSDQDDVWFNKKIETVIGVFHECDDLMVVINDQEITDANLNSSGLTTFSNTRALGLKDDWVCSGCSTALRHEFINFLVPFPADLIPHDNWIHLASTSLGSRRALPCALQYYRRHGGNVSNSIASQLVEGSVFSVLNQYTKDEIHSNWLKEISVLQYLCGAIESKIEMLKSLGINNNAEAALKFMHSKIYSIETRLKINNMSFLERSWNAILFYIQGNYRYFSGYKSLLKDIFY